MKISFFGTPKIAAEVLEKLAKTQYKPQLVTTGTDVQQGRGRKLEKTPVKEVAQKNQIKTLEPENLSDANFLKEFSTFEPDVAILVAYGKIIPDEVLIVPKFGFINIHPSLLPNYRGPSPIVSSILSGDKSTGVTLIVLDSELDHGPMLAQKEVEIENTDTHDSLASKLAKTGADLLVSTLPQYLRQNITPQPQNHENATWTEKIEKINGKISLEKPPEPEILERMIRAYFPWPNVWTEVDGKRIKFLPEGKVQMEGKKPMTLKEFTNGYPKLKELVSKILPSTNK